MCVRKMMVFSFHFLMPAVVVAHNWPSIGRGTLDEGKASFSQNGKYTNFL